MQGKEKQEVNGTQTYTRCKHIGSGSQGEVWLVEGSDKKQYCMKIIKRHRQDEKFFLEKVLEENSNELLKIYEIFKRKDVLHVISEYYYEGNLQQFIKDNKLSQKGKVISRIVLDICKQLQIIHKLGYLFVDLKPDNIIIKSQNGQYDTPGTFKLCDFGSVINLQRQSGSRDAKKQYRAPESFIPDYELNTSFDIWSLGVLIYEMIKQSTLIDDDKTFDKHRPNQSYQEEIFNKIDQLQVENEVKQIVKEILNFDDSRRPTLREIQYFFRGYSIKCDCSYHPQRPPDTPISKTRTMITERENLNIRNQCEVIENEFDEKQYLRRDQTFGNINFEPLNNLRNELDAKEGKIAQLQKEISRLKKQNDLIKLSKTNQVKQPINRQNLPPIKNNKKQIPTKPNQLGGVKSSCPVLPPIKKRY